MKVRPASVHFLAKVGFSLSYHQVSHYPKLAKLAAAIVQSHNPDVCPDSPALLLFV